MTNFNTSEIKNLSELIEILNSSKLEYNIPEIEEAYNFAAEVHKDQKRESGKPMIVHLLTVAAYIARLNLDTTSIVAALLHDSIEKGNADLNVIDNKFGTEVAFIVEGLTHVKSVSKKFDDEEVSIENFKNLIFNVAEDIRIIIIRLAEKLHNLISVNDLDPELRKKAANKALKIYGPLAEYLGLGYFQRALEDIAFKILEPNEYNFIEGLINDFFKSQKNLIEEFENEIKELLDKYKVSYLAIEGRKKGVYSTYKKIKKKFLNPGEKIDEKSFSKLKDVFAARIILNNVEDCYLVLGLINSKWEFDEEDFDDYITKPKENGYRSIQTIVKYKNAFFEVQIRTKEMHDYNEFGPASHIAYKMFGSQKTNGKSLTWTRDLVKWKDSKTLTKEDFKIKIFADSIFVFTPKSLLIKLNKDGTPLDFAFRIHSGVGSHYNGALVNGKMVSMDYKLKTGDIVEILTTKKRTVNPSWLKIGTSSNTKTKIRKELRSI